MTENSTAMVPSLKKFFISRCYLPTEFYTPMPHMHCDPKPDGNR